MCESFLFFILFVSSILYYSFLIKFIGENALTNLCECSQKESEIDFSGIAFFLSKYQIRSINNKLIVMNI